MLLHIAEFDIFADKTITGIGGIFTYYQFEKRGFACAVTAYEADLFLIAERNIFKQHIRSKG